jgi:hypothetical protein
VSTQLDEGSLDESMSSGHWQARDRSCGRPAVVGIAADQRAAAGGASSEDGQMSLLELGPVAGTRASGSATAPGWADVVDAAVGGMWPGIVLEPMRLAGRLVRPVVQALPAATDRIRVGVGPELDRSTLALWECWPADMGELPPPRPVRIVGFVAEGRWRVAVSTAAQLCGYGASVLVRRSVPARVRLAEADYHGITVIVVGSENPPSVAVAGRTGPVPGAERTVAVRHLEEKLFAQLLSQGRLSTGRCVRSG